MVALPHQCRDRRLRQELLRPTAAATPRPWRGQAVSELHQYPPLPGWTTMPHRHREPMAPPACVCDVSVCLRVHALQRVSAVAMDALGTCG